MLEKSIPLLIGIPIERDKLNKYNKEMAKKIYYVRTRARFVSNQIE